ncbi:hypothetical protein SNEBB_002908 [Seison nebaliae]|nr:hypothetical protein SNEBB_002908 [Seison nebaliae]
MQSSNGNVTSSHKNDFFEFGGNDGNIHPGTNIKPRYPESNNDNNANKIMSADEFSMDDNLSDKTNLIVNYLPQNFSQDDMKNIFGNLGELRSCKLIRDKTTNQSLGYGFVNYMKHSEAEFAINSLNGVKIYNKVIKVSYARPSCESIKGANLYICGVPKSWDLNKLDEYFGQSGKIITSRILYDQSTGQSKGVAFIRYDTKNEAQNAIDQLNMTIPEKNSEPLTVKFANTPGQLGILNNQIKNGNILTNPLGQLNGNLAGNIGLAQYISAVAAQTGLNNYSTSQLLTLLQQLQQQTPIANGLQFNPSMMVQNAAMFQQLFNNASNLQNSATTQSQISPNDAALLMNMLGVNTNNNQSNIFSQGNGMQSTSSQIALALNQLQQPMNHSQQPATSNLGNIYSTDSIDSLNMVSSSNNNPNVNDQRQGASLLIQNLGPEVRENDLWSLFGPFGAIHQVFIGKDANQKGKGYGVITMNNYNEAVAAIQRLNGSELHGRGISVTLAGDQPIFHNSTNSNINSTTINNHGNSLGINTNVNTGVNNGVNNAVLNGGANNLTNNMANPNQSTSQGSKLNNSLFKNMIPSPVPTVASAQHHTPISMSQSAQAALNKQLLEMNNLVSNSGNQSSYFM